MVKALTQWFLPHHTVNLRPHEDERFRYEVGVEMNFPCVKSLTLDNGHTSLPPPKSTFIYFFSFIYNHRIFIFWFTFLYWCKKKKKLSECDNVVLSSIHFQTDVKCFDVSALQEYISLVNNLSFNQQDGMNFYLCLSKQQVTVIKVLDDFIEERSEQFNAKLWQGRCKHRVCEEHE